MFNEKQLHIIEIKTERDKAKFGERNSYAKRWEKSELLRLIYSREESSAMHIQVLLKSPNDKFSFGEACTILKTIYQFFLKDTETKKDDSSNVILKIIPSFNLCINYIKIVFSWEEAEKHQVLPILYHFIRTFLKFKLFDPALDCGNYLQILLSDDKQKPLDDIEAYIKNLSVLFWNEALQVEKR
ncbi:hypothetical protein CEXT_783451 [Caerostris extrusa]|uniref:Uncharacterized protein n=1 Tax=Caerostris extrusa TaxID=172846 RepID=A0AAV4N2Z8_CAEEX|nr:hypothetical protein CEXT_783451 [Caerostris extrusa]